MRFTIDESGAVAANLTGSTYIQVIPVTVYQFERYVWREAPETMQYESVIDVNKRIAPDGYSRKNFVSSFISNVSFVEACDVCAALVNGRPPTVKEWEIANEMIFQRGGILSLALEFTESSSQDKPVDQRVKNLMARFIKIGIKRLDHKALGELVSEFPASDEQMYGQIFLKSSSRERALVTGNPPGTQRDRQFHFRAVFEKE